MKKTWIKVLAAAVILLLAVIFLLPLFVNANTFRPMLESQLSQALGRQVTLGNLRFSLFTGDLAASNISIAEAPAFGAKPFFQAASLKIGVQTWPLIFHRRLVVNSFTAESPLIRLVNNGHGVWNFSSLGQNAASDPPRTGQESAFPDLKVGALKIENGAASVSTLGSPEPPFRYTGLNVSATKVSFASSFPFRVSAVLPGGGAVSIDGEAGPVAADASDTPFNATLKVKNFDPVAAGVLPASDGISMSAALQANLHSDGQSLGSDGGIQADRLQLVRSGSPAPQPVDLTYTLTENLATRSGQIEKLNIQTGTVAALVTGTYQLGAQETTLALKISAPHLPIDQVENLLPAVGVRLPSGSRLEGGSITADLSADGPVSALTIAGPVEVDGTRLAGFDLGSKIGGLNPLASSPQGTLIRTLRANVTSSPAGTQIQSLYADLPALGTATGNGTISPQDALNFQVLAKLSTTSGVAGQALSGLSSASGALGSLLGGAVKQGIPVTITGNTSNPVIRANLGGMLGRQLGQKTGNGQTQQNPVNLLNKFLPH